MTYVHVSTAQNIAEVTLQRGKVNALNEEVVDELAECFRSLATDHAVRSVILTGTGKFFSFGFDVPGFLTHPKEAFLGYIRKFAALYRNIFGHPKPVVAALNGHAVAGGCMLALACDARVMAAGNGKLALNEITFGSSLFAGSVEMLRHTVGSRSAQALSYSGTMLGPEEALRLGLVDCVVSEPELMPRARDVASAHGAKDPVAFRSVKMLLRGPVLEEMARREEASLREFVDIWYSERTWERLKKIEVRG